MSAAHAGSLGSLREGNLKMVVEALLRRGTASRAELARDTGLSRSTISTLVNRLEEDGLIERREDADGRSANATGRPPELLAFSHSAGGIVGIDFGHDQVRVAVSDLSYEVLAEKRVALDIDHASAEGLDQAERLVHATLAETDLDLDRVLGVGMGIPGPIDRTTGEVQSSAILPSWIGISPAREMSDRLGMEVHTENDANLGALAEATLGAGRRPHDAPVAPEDDVVVYLRISAGIGAGLVIGGQLFRGSRGVAGEIGHIVVNPEGRVCRCGSRGCLETLAAPPMLARLIGELHGREFTTDEVVELAAGGDPGAIRVIGDAGRATGRAIADLANYLNPRLVVVGGELSSAGELLLEPMRAAIRRFAIPAAADGVAVVAGALGDRAEVLGALVLAGRESRAPVTELALTPTPSTHTRRVHT